MTATTAHDRDFDELDDEDFRDDPPAVDDAGADDDAGALGPLGQAARRLRLILLEETALARAGGLGDFQAVIRDKQQALGDFAALADAAEAAGPPDPADGEEVRRMMDAAHENSQVLEAVRTTIDDFSTRLRRALTSVADPETYGPKARGPRFAMAAQVDTKI